MLLLVLLPGSSLFPSFHYDFTSSGLNSKEVFVSLLSKVKYLCTFCVSNINAFAMVSPFGGLFPVKGSCARLCAEAPKWCFPLSPLEAHTQDCCADRTVWTCFLCHLGWPAEARSVAYAHGRWVLTEMAFCLTSDFLCSPILHKESDGNTEHVWVHISRMYFWFVKNVPEDICVLLFGATCLLPFSTTVCHDGVSSDGRRKLNNGTVSLNTQARVLDVVSITYCIF